MSSVPFKVKAVFDYSSPHEDDLNFTLGQVITITEETDSDWYVGEYTNDGGEKVSGLFPRNFVERYEPEIPSRPTRPARPTQTTTAADTIQQTRSEPSKIATDETSISTIQQAPITDDISSVSQTPKQSLSKPLQQSVPLQSSQVQHAEPSQSSQPEKSGSVHNKEQPQASPGQVKAPPPVAEKSSSFKDRIAAFNKQQAAPALPFKPTAAAAAGYGVKKPFVAAPPSRNAFVPIPKAGPIAPIYRREEDVEIVERIAEDQAAAQNAGLTGDIEQSSDPLNGRIDDDTPKPQSLKERIALLQQQQMEQAQKRVDTSSKEKPKRPAKKRTESSEQIMADDAGHDDSETSMPARGSLDFPETRAQPRTSTSLRASTIFSDGNEADQSAAGETTEQNEDTSDTEAGDRERVLPDHVQAQRAPAAPIQEADVGDEEDSAEETPAEDQVGDEIDEETRRKAEIRERMAKISGGMGMTGMFGAPQPGMALNTPKSQQKSSSRPNVENDESMSNSSSTYATRPMIPIPGMTSATPLVSRTKPDAEDIPQQAAESEADQEIQIHRPRSHSSGRRSLTQERTAPPPIPVDSGRPMPPMNSRPLPPRLPSSDRVEQTSSRSRRSIDNTRESTPMRSPPPPVPNTRTSFDQSRPIIPAPSVYNNSLEREYSEASIASIDNPQTIRAPPPPVPQQDIESNQASPRPPPPPVPAPSLISPPGIKDPDEGQSEYEGDYDTDIGSSEKHRDALKVHNRHSTIEKGDAGDDSSAVPSPSVAQRHTPLPPRPTAPAPPINYGDEEFNSRKSTDTPRANPPPIPFAKSPPLPNTNEDDGFGLYQRYQESVRANPASSPPPPPPKQSTSSDLPLLTRVTPSDDSHEIDYDSDDLYHAPTKKSIDAPRLPPSPPAMTSPPLPEFLDRASFDVNRGLSRKSTDNSRPLNDGYMATDIDLGESSLWWTQTNLPPPSINSRQDVLYEVEESSNTKRGGKSAISKDVYILYPDYSQTIISASFDAQDPHDVVLDQRHEPPPPKLRQDQLEQAWQTYGRHISDSIQALMSRKDPVSQLGDGSSFALPLELLDSFSSSSSSSPPLRPINNRSYGAVIYINIGNASVQQYDEIRPGDFITFRNAKLQGKHGGLHTKYSTEIGTFTSTNQGHVAVVTEWDGTKKKVKVLEQSKDEKGRIKVRSEGYKLGDLKSGEVKVWRVVGREWVGWDK